MIATLHIQTVCKNGITSLRQSYFTPPFKVANITEDKRSSWLHLMVMNSSPGILDGDDYNIKIELKENSFLHLHTQSYQRLFTMKSGAKQLTTIHLEKDCSLIYLPHPSVPHENADFVTTNKIFLNDRCNLLWGEVLTCGRKLSLGLLSESKKLQSDKGEVFQFSKYHTITEIFLHDKLIIRENLLMQPSLINPANMGQLEGYTHQASLICVKENGVTIECLDEVYDFLNQEKDISFGVTSVAGNGMMVRILGFGAEQLHDLLSSVAFITQQYKINEPKPLHAG